MQPRLLRIIIPLAALVFGVIVVISVIQGSKPGGGGAVDESASTELAGDPAGTDEDATTQPTDVAEDPGEPVEDDAVAEAAPPERPEMAADAPSALSGLHFRIQPMQDLTPLGDLDDPDDPASIHVTFSQRGAGITDIALRNYYFTLERQSDNRYDLLSTSPETRPALALRRVIINDAIFLPAYDEKDPEPVWRELAPGEFVAEILNENEELVFTVHRTFTLGPAEGLITLDQEIHNHTAVPVNLQIEQWGPTDLPYTGGGYGDFRRIRFGYLDPRSSRAVLASEGEYLKSRSKVVAKAYGDDFDRWTAGQPTTLDLHRLWPNEASRGKNYTLSWVAVTNRYFSFAVFPHFDDPAAQPDKAFSEVAEIYFFLEGRGEDRLAQIGFDPQTGRKNPKAAESRYLALKLVSPTYQLAPGDVVELDMQAYAGALERSLLAKEEPYRSFNLRELVVFQLGCTWCTFQWLGRLLLNFLDAIDLVVRDWGLSIIILVLIVRTILHPLTKRGQVSMQRFQKKMGKLQPEMKKLQEKYKDNPKKLQQEQMRLYREHNVNPIGCLGMAPMFLQMPIWVALYAMLYFAIELRHEPAFYGIFQLFGGWRFLADLSQPDHFIYFGGPIFRNVPVLANLPIIGSLDALNILPILMGIVFYLQQKYMTPQNPNMSPEMETQQKIMRIVFPLIFPIMLYKAPSGLTLYIMTSSFIGILESRYIRAHVESLDLENEPARPSKKKRKKVVNRSAPTGTRASMSPKRGKPRR